MYYFKQETIILSISYHITLNEKVCSIFNYSIKYCLLVSFIFLYIKQDALVNIITELLYRTIWKCSYWPEGELWYFQTTMGVVIGSCIPDEEADNDNRFHQVVCGNKCFNFYYNKWLKSDVRYFHISLLNNDRRWYL